MVTILQSCSLQQTYKPWKNSKAFFEVSPQPKTKKIQQKGIRYKKEKNRKMVTLEQPNHPTLHIMGKQLGARLRLHPYPTKSVWIWPPFHNFVQKKVTVKHHPRLIISKTDVTKFYCFPGNRPPKSLVPNIQLKAHPCYPHTTQKYFWYWCVKCPTQGNWSQSKQPTTTNRCGIYLQLADGTFLSSNK